MLSKTQLFILITMFSLIYIILSTAAIGYWTTIKAEDFNVEFKTFLGIPYGISTGASPDNINYPEIEGFISTTLMIALINTLVFVPLGIFLAFIVIGSAPTLNTGA